MNTISAQQIDRGPVGCPHCADSGYLTRYPLDNYPHRPFGPLAWQVAGVPVDAIQWCDCDTGRAWRRQYQTGLQDVTQVRIDQAFTRAGIPARFDGLTFDTILPKHRNGKHAAIDAAREFAETGRSSSKAGLCLIGKPGVGKTGILSVAFRARLKVGAAGLWIELYSFFAEIQGEYGKENSQADEKVRRAQRASLLLLDDCGDPDRRTASGGVGPETDDKRKILWELVDYRHGQDMPTLITSNLTKEAFEAQWGERLAARIWELCQVVPVGGVDLRSVSLE